MDYVDSKLLAQSRFKTKLSNQLIIAMLSNEDLNKMIAKHEEKDKRYQKLVNESTERNTEILKQIYNEQKEEKNKFNYFTNKIIKLYDYETIAPLTTSMENFSR